MPAITIPAAVQARMDNVAEQHPDIACLDSKTATLPVGRARTPTQFNLYLLAFSLADGTPYEWVFDENGRIHFGSPADATDVWWAAQS